VRVCVYVCVQICDKDARLVRALARLPKNKCMNTCVRKQEECVCVCVYMCVQICDKDARLVRALARLPKK